MGCAIIAAVGGRLPAGSVTFLFTDVEGSTAMLHDLGAERYAESLAEHRRVLRAAVAAHDGVEVDTQGDAFFVAFPSPAGAVAAAERAQRELAVPVRMGIHTGAPHVTGEGYVGVDVHRGARIAAAAHGRQVVVSATTAALLPSGTLHELGEHRLKDFAEPVALYQLGIEPYPPLRTISNTNLPRPGSAFVGRDRELAEVVALLRGDGRLLTLTGPGGTGKTRLAVEAAAELLPAFKAGVFWVGLASLRDPSLVADRIAETVGAKGPLAAHIGGREMLLVLDNVEQVVGSGPQLAELVEACPRLRLLVTSRERLRVRSEHVYPVPPLAETDAVALFCARSGLAASDDIRTLCRALDDLPLALELAAARAAVLSPRQIIERLAGRLDLLKGGRDADPRQRTLRAAIEWSHDLLTTDEQRLFARLAVFPGDWTLDAAEDVAEADLDVLQSLVDKSLVRLADERFGMLETIREFARERWEASDEADGVRRRHARFFRRSAERLDARIRAGEPEEGPVGALHDQIADLRAAAEFALGSGDIATVREIVASLATYWLIRGLYREGRSWVEQALALSDNEDTLRRRLLSALGLLAYAQGDHATAITASDAAAALAATLGGATDRLALLREQLLAAFRSEDLVTAERVLHERFELARAVGNGVATSSCRLTLASIANKTGRHERAATLLHENLVFVRAKGQTRCEAYTLAAMAETAIARGRPQDAAEDALGGARRALQIADRPLTVHSLDLFAASAAARGDARRAAIILAVTEAARDAMGAKADPTDEAIRATALAALRAHVGQTEKWAAEGAGLDLESALDLAAAEMAGSSLERTR